MALMVSVTTYGDGSKKGWPHWLCQWNRAVPVGFAHCHPWDARTNCNVIFCFGNQWSMWTESNHWVIWERSDCCYLLYFVVDRDSAEWRVRSSGVGVKRPRSAASSAETVSWEGTLHVGKGTESAPAASKCACRVMFCFLLHGLWIGFVTFNLQIKSFNSKKLFLFSRKKPFEQVVFGFVEISFLRKMCSVL